MELISGLAALALAATTLTATTLTPPAGAATPTEAASSAADWLADEVTAGVAAGDFDFYPGQLIDAGMALAATGHLTQAHAVGDALEPMLVTSPDFPYGYVRSDEYDFMPPYEYKGEGRYANATAKAAAFTERIGRDASEQYDIDLIAQLEDLTDATGRIADDSFYGDFANTIGQSFAVEALANAGSSEAAAAAGALLARQCPAGFFPLDMDDACQATEVYPDVTALAVISLVESGITTDEATTAVTEATEWLESLQLADGSFPGDGGAAGANSNGTGLAGWALGVAGRTASAAKAGAWTRGLQVADAGACVSKAPTGAIAYNSVDFAEARDEGLSTKKDTWRIATSQAAPALAYAPAANAPLAISTPAVADESSTVAAVVRGLAAGEHGCVSLGATSRRIVGTGSDVEVPFELPAGTGTTHTFSVTTLSGTATSRTSVSSPTPSPTPSPTATPSPTESASPTASPTVSPTSSPTATPTHLPTPAPAPAAGELEVSKVEQVRNGSLRLAVTCDGVEACDGTLSVRTRRKLATPHGDARRFVVAQVPYHVPAGASEKVVMSVRPAVRRALTTTRRLPVVAVQRVRGADTVRTPFWLRRS